MYNKVGGSGGILSRENLNFQNLRNAIFGLLALMFALLEMLSLINSKAFLFGDPPFTHHIFSAGPPFEAKFFHVAPPTS